MGRGGHSKGKLGAVKRGGRSGCCGQLTGRIAPTEGWPAHGHQASRLTPGEKAVQRSEGEDSEPRIL